MGNCDECKHLHREPKDRRDAQAIIDAINELKPVLERAEGLLERYLNHPR